MPRPTRRVASRPPFFYARTRSDTLRRMPDATTRHEIELALLLEVIDCAFDKQSWHGPNLTSAARVDASLAAQRLPGRKTIWEQALHAAYWKQRVINKLVLNPGRLPRKGSNWPAMPEKPTKQAWAADVALLHELHRQLREAVAALRPERLDAKTRRLIHGVAFHDIYHAGQMRLLRKMLEGNDR